MLMVQINSFGSTIDAQGKEQSDFTAEKTSSQLLKKFNSAITESAHALQ